jgi:hypothetical protein
LTIAWTRFGGAIQEEKRAPAPGEEGTETGRGVASLALKDSLPPRKLRGTLSSAEGLMGGRAKRRRNKEPLEGESYVSPSLIGRLPIRASLMR